MPYKPAKLFHKNARIVILCTARFATADQLTPAVSWLQSMGYQVTLGDTIDKKEHQLGGTIQERTADFVTAYTNPDTAAIWVARGGYGSIQLLDNILEQLEPLFKNPHFKHPLLIGYSDVTVFHAAFQKNGLQTLHAFMPLEIAAKPATVLKSMQQVLTGDTVQVSFKNKQQLPVQELTAPVVGGNLSILYSLLGSDTLPDFKDHILFVEDIDEYLYHLERMLYALKRAGKLQGLKALLVGGMTAMRDHKIPFGKTAHEIITDLTASYYYPVIFNFPAGHIKNNYPVVLGKDMHIKITATTITCTQ